MNYSPSHLSLVFPSDSSQGNNMNGISWKLEMEESSFLNKNDIHNEQELRATFYELSILTILNLSQEDSHLKIKFFINNSVLDSRKLPQ